MTSEVDSILLRSLMTLAPVSLNSSSVYPEASPAPLSITSFRTQRDQAFGVLWNDGAAQLAIGRFLGDSYQHTFLQQVQHEICHALGAGKRSAVVY